MKCLNCGFENNNDIKYCANCGIKTTKMKPKGNNFYNYLAASVLLTAIETAILSIFFSFIASFVISSFFILIFAVVFPPLLILYLPLLVAYIINVVIVTIMAFMKIDFDKVVKVLSVVFLASLIVATLARLIY